MILLEKEKIEEPSGGCPIPEMLLFFDITTCKHHDTVKDKSKVKKAPVDVICENFGRSAARERMTEMNETILPSVKYDKS
jgi:hypothetical protein